MKPWSLRRATAQDAEALTQCITAAYSIYSDRIADLPPVADGVAEDIATNAVWIIEDDTGLLGGLVLILTDDCAKLANVAVDPAATGRGIGKALIAKAESYAHAQGASTLDLATHKDMPENIALYQHLGWQETGRDGARVFMSKPI